MPNLVMPKLSTTQTEVFKGVAVTSRGSLHRDETHLLGKQRGGVNKTLHALREKHGVLKFVSTRLTWELTTYGKKVAAAMFDNYQIPAHVAKPGAKKPGRKKRDMLADWHAGLDELDQNLRAAKKAKTPADSHHAIAKAMVKAGKAQQKMDEEELHPDYNNESEVEFKPSKRGRPPRGKLPHMEDVAMWSNGKLLAEIRDAKRNNDSQLYKYLVKMKQRREAERLPNFLDVARAFSEHSGKMLTAVMSGKSSAERLAHLAKQELRAKLERMNLAEHIDWTEED